MTFARFLAVSNFDGIQQVPISTNYHLKTPACFIRPINPTSAHPYDALHAKKSLLWSDLLQELKQFVTGKFLQLSNQYVANSPCRTCHFPHGP
jgi:hypothetical protein